MLSMGPRKNGVMSSAKEEMKAKLIIVTAIRQVSLLWSFINENI